MDDLLQNNQEQFDRICKKMQKLLVKKQKLGSTEPVQIIDKLYLSNYSYAIDKKYIEQHQIGLIVSCVKIDDKDKVQNVQYKQYLLRDKPDQNISQYFGQFHELVSSHIGPSNITNANVKNCMINCFSGKSRSPTLIISYLMKQNNLNYQQALNLVKQKQTNIEPNSGFVAQLKQYGSKIKQQKHQQQNKDNEQTQNKQQIAINIKNNKQLIQQQENKQKQGQNNQQIEYENNKQRIILATSQQRKHQQYQQIKQQHKQQQGKQQSKQQRQQQHQLKQNKEQQGFQKQQTQIQKQTNRIQNQDIHKTETINIEQTQKKTQIGTAAQIKQEQKTKQQNNQQYKNEQNLQNTVKKSNQNATIQAQIKNNTQNNDIQPIPHAEKQLQQDIIKQQKQKINKKQEEAQQTENHKQTTIQEVKQQKQEEHQPQKQTHQQSLVEVGQIRKKKKKKNNRKSNH